MVDLSADVLTVTDRIKVKGQPTRLTLNPKQTRLYVAESSSDAVAVISTKTHKVIEEIGTTAPKWAFANEAGFKGSIPNSVTVSPDGGWLYVTNGGANSVAVIRLASDSSEAGKSQIVGLIPTGWYPNSASVSADGSMLYVVNGKSNAGPNPQNCRDKGSLSIGNGIGPGAESACNAANQYVWQLTKAGFLSLPVPHGEALEDLTEQVAKNNHYGAKANGEDAEMMAFLRDKIKHVIYIVRENRTYDQILGDLGKGNGDPSIVGPAEYAIRLSNTEIEAPQGSLVVAATALRAGYAVMIEPKMGKGGEVHTLQPSKANSSNSQKGRQSVILRLDEGVLLPTPMARTLGAADEAGTRKVHAFLLTQLSASHSRKDDAFQLRLAEPVRIGDKLFEEGSLVDGRVSQRARPRMLSRAGSLHLHIDRITSPQGASIAIAGTLGGVEAGPGTKYALDDEGGLHGLKPGITNAVVDLSIAYALGKVTDDIAEAPIRAIGAAMSDAAVANAARYFGLGASAVFLVTRQGRDVYLPRYSAIEIDFGRPGEPASSSASLQP